MNTNTMDARIKELMALGATFPEAHAAALAEAKAFKEPRKGTGKPAPAKELVDFTKADGTVVKCTPAQAAAWTKWRDRDHMSLDAVKELKPEITDAGKAYVKAHPGCTRKEAAANGCKNITKDGLKALKRELGVR